MKALELDDTLAEAHAALAYVVFFATGTGQVRSESSSGQSS